MLLSLWIPLKTLVFLIGVLEWQDTGLATYSKENRQDQRLYEVLATRGVPKSNMLFMKEKSAILDSIVLQFEKILKKSDKESTFFFYYAGHGKKSSDGKNAYFLNYDCNTSDADNTCLSMQQIQQLIRKYFKGKQVILSADCCYSGSLNLVADSLAKSGIECLVYSSALESNSSTGAWTFTQSLCEILEGKPYISTKNKNIDLKTAADYIDYNMVYGEYQKSNFYTTSGFPKDFVLSPMNVDFSTKEHIGEIKKIPWSDSYSTCKIIDKKGDKFELHYFDSDVKLDKLQSYEILKNIEFIIYSVDEKIKVEWEHKYYPAVILKRDGFFHYIKYEGYGEEWNEWVASDRIKKE